MPPTATIAIAIIPRTLIASQKSTFVDTSLIYVIRPPIKNSITIRPAVTMIPVMMFFMPILPNTQHMPPITMIYSADIPMNFNAASAMPSIIINPAPMRSIAETSPVNMMNSSIAALVFLPFIVLFTSFATHAIPAVNAIDAATNTTAPSITF